MNIGENIWLRGRYLLVFWGSLEALSVSKETDVEAR